MKKNLFLHNGLLSFLIVLLLTQCKYTTTSQKQAILNIPSDSLSYQLGRIIVCKHIDITGKDIKAGGQISTELDISMINSKDLPSDRNNQNELAKKIATIIKNALQNKNDFDSYKVFFITETKSENAMGTITKKNYISFDFKKVEI